MIRTLVGDMFESEAQTLVNTVNCVGVMGKGIALEFKKRFPDMYEDYVQRCEAKLVKLGQPYIYYRLFPPYILNFPTKGHWRSVSRLSDITTGLDFLRSHYREWGIESLAVPPLGCGNGGLEWRVVGPTLYRCLSQLDVPIDLYAPQGTPAEQLELAFLAQNPEAVPADALARDGSRINPAWVALVEILARIVREPYHWPVGRTMFQKLTYFATESGLPTGLHFERNSYGPFAANLKPMLTRLVNNGLVHEEPRGRMYVVVPGPTYGDAAKMTQAQLNQWDPIIDRVADLFLRIQRTDQAEVAATVHFAARSLRGEMGATPSETDVLTEVKRWKERRKPPLDDEEIAHTIRNLNMLHWLDVKSSGDLPLPEEALLNA